jgi:hypothetical protein
MNVHLRDLQPPVDLASAAETDDPLLIASDMKKPAVKVQL